MISCLLFVSGTLTLDAEATMLHNNATDKEVTAGNAVLYIVGVICPANEFCDMSITMNGVTDGSHRE